MPGGHSHVSGMRGKKHASSSRLKISLGLTGLKYPNRRRASGWKRPDMVGPLNWSWGGGKSLEERDGRRLKYWKYTIHKRDNNTCQLCFKEQLAPRDRFADHIVAWRDAPPFRFSLWNGRTLCAKCHGARTGRQNRERILEERVAA